MATDERCPRCGGDYEGSLEDREYPNPCFNCACELRDNAARRAWWRSFVYFVTNTEEVPHDHKH